MKPHGQKNRQEARNVLHVLEPQIVSEGAGVRLRRSIGTRTLDYLDPFLLLDDFRSNHPNDYIAGFPMHPHRGIETVTYMLAGEVRHRDSLGNAGTIGPGDVQWMTAGRGIMHEEMPRPRGGMMGGFQLWVNLPAKLKMTAPRYQEVHSGEIPELQRTDGTTIRVIAGEADGTRGPVSEIAADPTYLDVALPADVHFRHAIPRGHAAFLYLFEGEVIMTGSAPSSGEIGSPRLIVLDDGDLLDLRASDKGARFLLVAGAPLHEPIARHGPFVMNTREEIEQALRDLRQGTFVT